MQEMSDEQFTEGLNHFVTDYQEKYEIYNAKFILQKLQTLDDKLHREIEMWKVIHKLVDFYILKLAREQAEKTEGGINHEL